MVRGVTTEAPMTARPKIPTGLEDWRAPATEVERAVALPPRRAVVHCIMLRLVVVVVVEGVGEVSAEVWTVGNLVVVAFFLVKTVTG